MKVNLTSIYTERKYMHLNQGTGGHTQRWTRITGLALPLSWEAALYLHCQDSEFTTSVTELFFRSC